MNRAEQVRQILSTRGLTLYRVSRQSAEIFGRSSRFYVPHNFYYDVADPSLIPTIHQMLALSHITNYRLHDWLVVFGFDLDHISRLQLLIPRQRTTLLDSSVYDVHAWIPWFVDRPNTGHVPPMAPVGQFLASATPRRAAELLALNKRRFLYAKVGEGDVLAFPHLAPGSIVRIDERRSGELLSEGRNNSGPRLFLVEHGSGFTCSQLLVLEKDIIMLHSPERPCAQLELRLGKEGRILGVVDAEIRPLTGQRTAGMPHQSTGLPKPLPLQAPKLQPNLKDLLKHSRLRAGLSFREASALSRRIANTLSDELYFAAPSTLSDYETLSTPPRHIQKIITLCVLYCIYFDEFLRTGELPLDQSGHDPIPDELVPRQVPNQSSGLDIPNGQESIKEHAGFLDSLMKQWEEVPLFLRHSLNELTGLKNFSPSDVFWVSGDKASSNPLLINTTFVVVNRRVKNPAQSKTVCEPPLCLLLKRDGSYLCGCCAVHQGNLVVRAYPGGRLATQQFRNGIDAEMIGQVTTILRRLL
ncbi:MAG TPA: hypothetical protein VFN26_06040 [Candidatus Acidoferrum sp.]|nr:hypothetical protein [Candidatus Acidoferrum sp.]